MTLDGRRKLFDAAAWFTMTAFLISVAGHYADSHELAGNAPAIVGGALAAVASALH